MEEKTKLMSRTTNLFTQLSRRSRRTLVISIAGVCLLGAIAYASIPDGNGVIHGCYKRNSGSLRVIDNATSQCDNSETAIQWSQTGPQGPPGMAAPPRLITIGTASGTLGPWPCGLPIRSLDFVKQSDTSVLRITYHDDGFVEDFSGDHEFSMGVLIDGLAIAPTPIHSIVQGDLENSAVLGSITAFGYANGIPAGAHTLTTHYFDGGGGTNTCWRGDAYTVEIEEISL